MGEYSDTMDANTMHSCSIYMVKDSSILQISFATKKKTKKNCHL